VVGSLWISASNSTYFSWSILASPSTSNLNVGFQSSTTSALGAATGSGMGVVSGTQLQFYAKVPIVGWSSNVQMSNDTDTRVVAFRASNPGGSSTSVPTGTSGTVIANLTSINVDTHGAWNSSTSTYTIPVSGYYKIVNSIYTNSTIMSINVGLKINGTYAELTSVYSANNTTAIGHIVSFYSAGTTIQPATYHSLGTTQAYATFNPTSFSVERLSGPSVIAATESVNANYYTTSTGSMAVGTPATVVFGTKNTDSHNAYNNTTGVYTVPISGKYLVTATVTTTATTQVQSLVLDVYRSGSGLWNRISVSRLAAVSSSLAAINATVVTVNAGDTIEIRCAVTAGTGNFDALATDNNFNIVRVGN
jgi:hypothetical protein